MSFSNWNINPEQVFNQSKIIAVIQINNVEDAIPIAESLFNGGIGTLEITLRTAAAIDAIKLLTKKYPQKMIGAGTIIHQDQLIQTAEAGAKFAFSPGYSLNLLKAGIESNIPFIPGVSTITEIIQAMDLGYQYFKLFPAMSLGGVSFLKSILSILPKLRFCPTGGLNQANFKEFLNLENVSCVGGSWIMPPDLILQKDWSDITRLSLSATQSIL